MTATAHAAQADAGAAPDPKPKTKSKSASAARAPASSPTITCSRADLVEALTTACSIAAKKSPRKILEDVLIVATPGERMELYATDGDTSARLVVTGADVEGDADISLEIAINAKRALDMCKAITDDRVTITPRDLGVIRIASASNAKTKFDVVTEPDPREFPDMAFLDAKDVAGLASVTVDGEALALALDRTAFAAASEKESARYAMNGTCFDWSRAGALTLVATNGKQLAVAPVAGGAPGSVGATEGGASVFAVLTAHAAAALRRFIEGAAKVNVRRNEFRMVFTCGDGSSGEVFSGQLLSGYFPPYEVGVPTRDAAKYTVALDRAALIEAVQAASLVNTTDSRAVRLSFAYQRVTIAARGPDAGESAVELACPGWTYEPFEIAFDPAMLLPALGVVDVDSVSFAFDTPARPGVMRLEDGYVYVIMPITIG